MAHPQPPTRLRGDEADVFAANHSRLVRVIRRRVNAPDAVVEDAISITWLIFMRCQSERSPTLFGWLVTVAEREAWRLAARGRRTIDLDELPCADLPAVPGPEDMVEARSRIERAARAMTARQRRILGLHAAGLSYREISEETGDTLRTVERQMHRGRRRARGAA